MILTNLADAEQDVAVTNFIAYSRASKEALKSANLLKSLQINVLIEGEYGVGKKTLASYIAPDAPVVDANSDELKEFVQKNDELIITDIEKIRNFQLFSEILKLKKIRIIATSNTILKNDAVDKIFSIKIYLPPLREREEDIFPLAEKFYGEAKQIFGDENDFDLSKADFDLRQNADSLRRSVFFSYLINNIDDKEIIKCMETFLFKHIGSGDDYRKFLYLYEVPLIKAGMKRFKSQLKMAEKFGLNRNTLRKKIQENGEYL
ncbi:helix-turn-helix domain-containing protein [Nitrosophilus alvini]|uniref:helix-turn-helix domain-containing protein n=1 Tax=Nitrosophilus alvini TaxID=2714855 RepID=UPI00190B52A3|nr:sigma 54-interacting transcriptional regulator [Nitrosophilus alvini]